MEVDLEPTIGEQHAGAQTTTTTTTTTHPALSGSITSIDKLPMEMLMQIFEYLDVLTMWRMKRVSHGWHDILRAMWPSTKHVMIDLTMAQNFFHEELNSTPMEGYLTNLIAEFPRMKSLTFTHSLPELPKLDLKYNASILRVFCYSNAFVRLPHKIRVVFDRMAFPFELFSMRYMGEELSRSCNAVELRSLALRSLLLVEEPKGVSFTPATSRYTIDLGVIEAPVGVSRTNNFRWVEIGLVQLLNNADFAPLSQEERRKFDEQVCKSSPKTKRNFAKILDRYGLCHGIDMAEPDFTFDKLSPFVLRIAAAHLAYLDMISRALPHWDV